MENIANSTNNTEFLSKSHLENLSEADSEHYNLCVWNVCLGLLKTLQDKKKTEWETTSQKAKTPKQV